MQNQSPNNPLGSLWLTAPRAPGPQAGGYSGCQSLPRKSLAELPDLPEPSGNLSGFSVLLYEYLVDVVRITGME